MIEVVINYDSEKGLYKVYEPTSDTILATSSLGESLLKLSHFLVDSGMIQTDILHSNDITYHFDSASMMALMESNVGLLKRLNDAPSGFENSSRRFGMSGGSSGGGGSKQWGNKKDFGSKGWKSIGGQKSTFSTSGKKFGNRR